MTRAVRVWALALAFVVAGCVARTSVSAPPGEPSPTTSASATATPRPPNASNDLLYVRQHPGGDSRARIAVVDARTGAIVRELPDGVLSPDRSLLYSAEMTDGSTRTVIHVLDVTSGNEVRSFSLAGGTGINLGEDGAPSGITPDGRRLILRRSPMQVEGKWVTSIAVVDTASGSVLGRVDLEAKESYAFVALSGDHVALLNGLGGGLSVMRAYDMATQAFLPDPAFAGWDGRQQVGYRTPFTPSADGRWLFALDTGSAEPGAGAFVPYVLALDVSARRAVKIPLPAEQRSTDFEKYLLWTLALTTDGSTLYAANGALGVIDEIDATQMTLHRTQRRTREPQRDDTLARLRRVLFPTAEAKRYVRGGAVLSPDGGTLYTIGNKGIAVIETASLQQRSLWQGDKVFDSLALSPDGARLYAIRDDGRRISIIGTHEGTCSSACQPSLGEIQLFGFLTSIVRIDAR